MDTDDFELYVDGVALEADTGGALPTAYGTVTVGNDQVVTTRLAWANIRNVQIFSERLSSNDVARIR